MPAGAARRHQRVELLLAERAQVLAYGRQLVALAAVRVAKHGREVPRLVVQHEAPRYEVVYAHGAVRGKARLVERHARVDVRELVVAQGRVPVLARGG